MNVHFTDRSGKKEREIRRGSREKERKRREKKEREKGERIVMERFVGIIIGAICFLSIGIWHPIVIKGEYYFGKKKCMPVFFLIGMVCVILSIILTNLVASVGLAVFGFSALWGVGEVIEQEKRVQRGWFPKRDKGEEKDIKQDKK